MKNMLKDRQSLKEAVIVMLIFPLVYFGMHLLGWGNEMFNWWQTLIVALVAGTFYWFCSGSFRRFRDQDVTPG